MHLFFLNSYSNIGHPPPLQVLGFVKAQYPGADVRAFALFAPDETAGVSSSLLRYVVRRGRVPFIWPWGVEMD